MTSISNIGGITPDDGQNKTKTSETTEEKAKNIRIFDLDGNGILSASEQESAVFNAVYSDEIVQKAQKFGFKVFDFMKTLKLQDIDLKNCFKNVYIPKTDTVLTTQYVDPAKQAKKIIDDAISQVKIQAKKIIDEAAAKAASKKTESQEQ